MRKAWKSYQIRTFIIHAHSRTPPDSDRGCQCMLPPMVTLDRCTWVPIELESDTRAEIKSKMAKFWLFVFRHTELKLIRPIPPIARVHMSQHSRGWGQLVSLVSHRRRVRDQNSNLSQDFVSSRQSAQADPSTLGPTLPTHNSKSIVLFFLVGELSMWTSVVELDKFVHFQSFIYATDCAIRTPMLWRQPPVVSMLMYKW
jgi:hypothetical protein